MFEVVGPHGHVRCCKVFIVCVELVSVEDCELERPYENGRLAEYPVLIVYILINTREIESKRAVIGLEIIAVEGAFEFNF